MSRKRPTQNHGIWTAGNWLKLLLITWPILGEGYASIYKRHGLHHSTGDSWKLQIGHKKMHLHTWAVTPQLTLVHNTKQTILLRDAKKMKLDEIPYK